MTHPYRGGEEHKDTDEKRKVADAVYDKRLFTGGRLVEVCVPEPDQEVRTEPDTFPPHKENGDTLRHYQREHRKHKEVQIGKVPRIAVVFCHVPNRVKMDHRTDKRDDEHHDHRERVDHEREIDMEITRDEPRKERLRKEPFLAGQSAELEENHGGDGKRDERCETPDKRHQALVDLALAIGIRNREQAVYNGAAKRCERYEPQIVFHPSS